MRARGRVVALCGPDGSGKTTLCEQIVASLGVSRPVSVWHHRFGVLPARSRGDFSRPHDLASHGRFHSVAKLGYLYVDITLGWAWRVAPKLRRGEWVIIERPWWDMAVDPRRYRLSAPPGLIRGIGRFVPLPDIAFVLHAPPELLHRRKPELTVAEIAAQLGAWENALPAHVKQVRLDAALPSAAIATQALRELRRIDSRAACPSD